MGDTYGHVIALTTSVEAVSRALGNEPAFISAIDDTVLVFSEGAVSDSETVAAELSAATNTTVVGFSVLDDVVLAGALCQHGEIIASVAVPTLDDYVGIDADELELMAEYLGESVPDAGSTSEPTSFVMGVGATDPRRALVVLSDSYDNGAPVSATNRHRDLLAALGLPEAAAGWDYYRFENGTAGFEGPPPIRVGH